MKAAGGGRQDTPHHHKVLAAESEQQPCFSACTVPVTLYTHDLAEFFTWQSVRGPMSHRTTTTPMSHHTTLLLVVGVGVGIWHCLQLLQLRAEGQGASTWHRQAGAAEG